MASETILVQIDPAQLELQKNNRYNLCLAKKINGVYTVIWQSQAPIASAGNPSYGPNTSFSIEVAGYNVNYSSQPITQGSVTEYVSGIYEAIQIGQSTTLSSLGLFSPPANNAPAGSVVIYNNLGDNPYPILADHEKKPIYVGKGGMDKGDTTLTPIDTYQIWFDSLSASSTIVDHQMSNVWTVTFDGTSTSKTISYNAEGQWQDGGLDSSIALPDESGLSVNVDVLFSKALSLAAVTFLASKFFHFFPTNLQPESVLVAIGGMKLQVVFKSPKIRQIVERFGPNKFCELVNDALIQSKHVKDSGLADEKWTFTNIGLEVTR